MDFLPIALGVGMFTAILLVMVSVLLFAKSKLVTSGKVRIVINGDESSALEVDGGGTLLGSLAERKIFIPSACGGGGTCAQCLVKIHEGNTGLLPTEEGHINRVEAAQGCRLSCQVKIKNDMHIEVPASVFSVKKWDCTVETNHNVATFIKEFKVRLPEGERMDFKNGEYIQIEIPPYKLDYKEFDIEEEYHEDWDKYDIWQHKAWNDEPVERAYSMAN